jgi:ADP-ribose pyrophosphatase
MPRLFRQMRAMDDEKPQILSSRCVFQGLVFDVRVDEVGYADGSRHRVDVVEHGGSFVILAMPSPNELVLVRQYRHAVREMLWEVPAGTAEPGEDALAGAARELREETGYAAARLRLLCSLYPTPGFCDELMHFVAAEELSAGEQALDEDERIEVRTFSWEAAWRLVAENGIADMKTVLAMLWMRGGRGEVAPALCR